MTSYQSLAIVAMQSGSQEKVIIMDTAEMIPEMIRSCRSILEIVSVFQNMRDIGNECQSLADELQMRIDYYEERIGIQAVVKITEAAGRALRRTLHGTLHRAIFALKSQEAESLKQLAEPSTEGHFDGLVWWLFPKPTPRVTNATRNRKVENILKGVIGCIDRTFKNFRDSPDNSQEREERNEGSSNINAGAGTGGELFLLSRILQLVLEIEVVDVYLMDSLKRKIDDYGQKMMMRTSSSVNGSLVNPLEGAAIMPVNRSNSSKRNTPWSTLEKAEAKLTSEQSELRKLDKRIEGGQCDALGWWLYAKLTMKRRKTMLEEIIKEVTDEIDKKTRTDEIDTTKNTDGKDITLMPSSSNADMVQCISQSPEMDSFERSLVTITADAKVLLFLIYACKAGSVPGEVLTILHSATKPLHPFHSCINELIANRLIQPSPARKLIKLDPERQEQIERDMRESLFSFCSSAEVWAFIMELQADFSAWSLPNSVKSCMEERDEIKHVLGALLGGDESDGEHNIWDSESEDTVQIQNEKQDEQRAKECRKHMDEEAAQVTIVLCALYFAQAEDNEGTAKELNVISKFSPSGTVPTFMADWARNVAHLQGVDEDRKTAIEPLIWLLRHDPTQKEGKWKGSNVSCVRKVFLNYVCKGQIDYTNMSALLRLNDYPSAQLATLVTTARILAIEERLEYSLKDDAAQCTLKDLLLSLVDLLGSKDQIMRDFSLRPLLCILRKATKDQAASIMADVPNILDILVRSSQDSHASPLQLSHELAVDATRILWKIASKDEVQKDKLVNVDGALASFVKSLSNDENPPLQECAAGALMSLATGGESMKLRILKEDGALVAIVKSSSKRESPGLEINATKALVNLSFGGQDVVNEMLKLDSKDGVLPSLVRSLFRHDKHDLQNIGASALSNLAASGDRIKSQILKENRALSGLIKALCNGMKPTLATIAARALWSLASGGERIKYSMLKQDGVLSSLVTSLSQNNNSTLQEYAAGALMSLAAGGESIKLKIVTEVGALAAIVTSLSSSKPKLVENATGVLKNLASGDKFVNSIIANASSAIQSLLDCLDRHDNTPQVQKNALRALSNLAQGNEIMQDRILKKDQALPNLIRELSNNKNPLLQRHAALALGNLATTASAASRILQFNGGEALKGLANSLIFEDGNPDLQRDAAGVLWDLASKVKKTEMIANHPRAITGLVWSLFKNDNPDLQRNATGALWILAEEEILAGEEKLILVILDKYQALKKMKSKQKSSDLQNEIEPTLITFLSRIPKTKLRSPQLSSNSYHNEIVPESPKSNLMDGAEKIAGREYFTRGHYKQKARQQSDAINDRRRKQIEPLILLLDQEPNNDHQQLQQQRNDHKQWADQSSIGYYVSQAFLKYVVEGQLDENILELLKTAPMHTLRIIRIIFSTEEASLLSPCSKELFEAVMNLMESNEGSSVQESASRALLLISRKYVREQPTFIRDNIKGICDVLLRTVQSSISSVQSHTLASNAVKTLCELGYSLSWESDIPVEGFGLPLLYGQQSH